MRTWWLGLALSLVMGEAARAEWQVRPFIGFTFGGASTFVDIDDGTQLKHMVIGASGGWLGEIFGFEGDFGRSPGYFENDKKADPLILTSAVTTLTGNVVIAMPRRLSGYSLRPYFSGGAGLMHIDASGALGGLAHNRTLPTLSLGGGVTGFVTDNVGVSWDIRRLNTLRGEGETLGNSLGREQLSFWRATIAVALR